MTCVNEQGQINASAKKVLEAIEVNTLTPQDISKSAGVPLFKVRSGLREMLEVGFVTEESGSYKITEKGQIALNKSK